MVISKVGFPLAVSFYLVKQNLVKATLRRR
jgi:hypothetical protein